MERARSLALGLLSGLVVVLGALVYRLTRQYGQTLLDRDMLVSRLARLVAFAEAGPEAEAGPLFRTVRVEDGTRFEIALDPRLMDPISRAVAVGDHWYLQDYSVLLEVMQPGDTVVDLGGHIGTFSLAAAAKGCRVLCIEAAPDNVALLRASAARNGFDQLHVVAGAATDHEGTLSFTPNGPWGTISNAAVSATPALIYGRQLAPVTAPAVSLDGVLQHLGWERIDFIKIDVEGSELSAMGGMTRLLSRSDAPTVLYESNGHALSFFGQTPDRLVAKLREHGYTSYQLDSGRLVPLRRGELQVECVVNCLAVKGQPPTLRSWPVAQPRSTEETVRKIVAESKHADRHHRAYVARALAHAAPAIVKDARVATALTSLSNDPDDAVRKAAAWFREAIGGTTEHHPRSKVLILTPVKDAADLVDNYCDRLLQLTYPHSMISLGLLESDSSDTTFQEFQRHIPALRTEFRRVDLWKRDFDYRIPLCLPRWTPEIQVERRSVLAKSRNHLLFHALRDEDWVLWLDADVVEYPPNLIERLLATGKDIVQPHCVLTYGGKTFDLNGWRDERRLHLDALRAEGELVELDTVGATVLLIRADLHRDGLVFPAFRYTSATSVDARSGKHKVEGEIESEGLGFMARDLDYRCWGMPHLEVIHRGK